jgi:hypothetical protein
MIVHRHPVLVPGSTLLANQGTYYPARTVQRSYSLLFATFVPAPRLLKRFTDRGGSLLSEILGFFFYSSGMAGQGLDGDGEG